MLSDLVHGEVLGLAPDRTEESLETVLTTHLDARQRAAVEAVCTDMQLTPGTSIAGCFGSMAYAA